MRTWRRTAGTCTDSAAWGNPVLHEVGETRSARRARFAFLADGSLVTADGRGFTIHGQGPEETSVPADFFVQGITLSGDRGRLMLFGVGELRAYDLRAGQPPRLVARFHQPNGNTSEWSLAVDPHGNRVAIHPVATDNVVILKIPAVPVTSGAENADPLRGLRVPDTLVLRGQVR